MDKFATLSFDGKGINDVDEYRSRIATFVNSAMADKYGQLFEAAPELQEALDWALQFTPTGAAKDRAKRILDRAAGKGE